MRENKKEDDLKVASTSGTHVRGADGFGVWDCRTFFGDVKGAAIRLRPAVAEAMARLSVKLRRDE
jgi:hypothetical protein